MHTYLRKDKGGFCVVIHLIPLSQQSVDYLEIQTVIRPTE